MSSPPPTAQQRRDRHGSRHRRTARRVRRTATVVGVLAVSVAAVLVATDTIRFPGPAEPDLMPRAGALRLPGGTEVDPGAPPRNARPLTADDPLRLWIGGDSLAGSLGPSLGEMTATTGVVKPVYASRVSSGLMSPAFYDWPRHAEEQMRTYDPEAVVFIIGANDFPAVSDGPTGPDGRPAWETTYAAKVEEMLAVLKGPGRDVYWVGVPVMRSESLNSDVREINEVIRSVLARHPEVTYVDGYRLFTDTAGDFAPSLPDDAGTQVRVRSGDGIHLTPAGGDRMAEAVFRLLDARWDIHAQTVPGHRQPVTEVEGSTRVPGTGRRVTLAPSRSYDDGSSGSGDGTDPGASTTTTTPAEQPTEQVPPSTSPTTSATPPSTPPTTPPTTPPASAQPPAG